MHKYMVAGRVIFKNILKSSFDTFNHFSTPSLHTFSQKIHEQDTHVDDDHDSDSAKALASHSVMWEPSMMVAGMAFAVSSPLLGKGGGRCGEVKNGGAPGREIDSRGSPWIVLPFKPEKEAVPKKVEAPAPKAVD